MSCCCPHSSAAGSFFSRFAKRYHKRFLKKGLEKPQQQLVEGVRAAGIQGATILEIGSGVGYLYQTLVNEGAESAVGIDLASRMLTEAEKLAEEQGLQDKVVYLHGDFVNLADDVDDADITLLDKVVCCYPDAEALVKQSLARTRRIYALTYPRNRWYNHAAMTLGRLLMWIMRSDFRPYVHDPLRVEAWITDSGLQKSYENTTLVWLTQVYVRS